MLKFIKTNLLVICIIILASFLRLYNIGSYAEFLGDQGRDLIIIRDFLVNHNLFFIGPQTSIGNMYLGPYFYYLIAPSLLLANFNPVGPAIFMALIGIATVYLLYYAVILIFEDKRAAIIASFLFAISPAAIKYSTFSWNPNIMPFFSLLFIIFCYQALIQSKYSRLIPAVISFIFCFNSHFLSLLLLPFAFIFWLYNLIINIKKNDRIHVHRLVIFTVISVLIFIISLAPLVLFDIKHQGQNINAFINFFRYRETTVNLKIYKSIFQIIPITGQVISDLLGLKLSAFTVGSISLLLLAFSSFSLFKKYKLSALYIIAWLAIGLIGLGLYKQHIYTHYFGFIFPAPFLVLGLLLSTVLPKNYILASIAVAFISLPSVLSQPLLTPPQRQITHAYNLSRAIIEHLDSADSPYNVSLLASYNDFRAMAPRYFLIKDSNNNILSPEEYPQAKTLFLIQDDPVKWSNPFTADIYEIKSFAPYKIDSQFTTSDNVTIYKLSKNDSRK